MRELIYGVVFNSGGHPHRLAGSAPRSGITVPHRINFFYSMINFKKICRFFMRNLF